LSKASWCWCLLRQRRLIVSQLVLVSAEATASDCQTAGVKELNPSESQAQLGEKCEVTGTADTSLHCLGGGNFGFTTQAHYALSKAFWRDHSNSKYLEQLHLRCYG